MGAEVLGVQEGDRVTCSGNGSYAEYAATDWGRVSPVPADAMGWEQAAALPIALQTMHDALMTNGQLRRGKAVLIQDASSGVGLMGLEIARFLKAGLVIGSSTDTGRRARLPKFGADLAVDSNDPAWPGQVLAATSGQGVDLISTPVSRGNLQATRVLGRIVNVGRLGGAKGEFDFDLHAMRPIAYTGVTFRTRSLEEVREIKRRMREAASTFSQVHAICCRRRAGLVRFGVGANHAPEADHGAVRAGRHGPRLRPLRPPVALVHQRAIVLRPPVLEQVEAEKSLRAGL